MTAQIPLPLKAEKTVPGGQARALVDENAAQTARPIMLTIDRSKSNDGIWAPRKKRCLWGQQLTATVIVVKEELRVSVHFAACGWTSHPNPATLGTASDALWVEDGKR